MGGSPKCCSDSVQTQKYFPFLRKKSVKELINFLFGRPMIQNASLMVEFEKSADFGDLWGWDAFLLRH